MNVLIAEARRMALSKGQRPASKGMCVVYFLRLRSGTVYIGASEDIEQRLDDHASGQACRTTRFDPAVALVRCEVFPTFSDARSREAQLKRWTRAKKEALIKGELNRLRTLSQSRESKTAEPEN
jgi:putative endonuclease